MTYSSIQLNSSPSIALENKGPLSIITPLVLGHHHPVKAPRFKPFECQAYVLNLEALKIQPTAQRMIFVGLEAGSNAYTLWNKKLQKIVISADVKFDENTFPAAAHPLKPSQTQIVDIFPDILATIPMIQEELMEEDRISPDEQFTTDDVEIREMQDEVLEDQVQSQHILTTPSDTVEAEIDAPIRRSTRTTVPSVQYSFISRETPTDKNDNPTYESAMNGPDKLLWRKAMDDEFQAFTQHNVGTLGDKSPDTNVLGGMWIFSRKSDKHHCVIKYKAQWFIFGHHQIHGLDFFDTYASVGKSDSLRILLSIAATEGWEIIQFDIVTAFLNGDMKDVVHCKQVRELNQSLYGSRQGARRWQEHFEGTINIFNLKPTPSDPAVYVANDHQGILNINLRVDDSMVTSN